jgi:putative Holliday junction resolvase
MGRVLAIDLGTKRTGLAVTDSLQLIANPLDTIPTHQLEDFLKKYVDKEEVETIVIGLPRKLDSTANEMTPRVLALKNRLAKLFPQVKFALVDERFTSRMALQTMIDMGTKKKDRREKEGNLDKISATIILQSYLQQQ